MLSLEKVLKFPNNRKNVEGGCFAQKLIKEKKKPQGRQRGKESGVNVATDCAVMFTYIN